MTLSVVGDTYLRSGSPNQNQGTSSYLRVNSAGNNRALVWFDPAEISSSLSGMTLDSAKLRLYIESNGNNWGASGRTVDVHRLSVAWTELGATWNCPDDSNVANSQADCAVQWGGGTFIATATDSVLHTSGLLGWVEWDVTADVVDMAANPAANHGWIIKKTDEGQTGLADYTSREGGANAPQLLLTFTN